RTTTLRYGCRLSLAPNCGPLSSNAAWRTDKSTRRIDERSGLEFDDDVLAELDCARVVLDENELAGADLILVSLVQRCHVKLSADAVAARASAKPQAAMREKISLFRIELGRVVGRFLRDGDVMRVVLPHTGGRDFDESSFRAKFIDRFGAAVAHAGSE